MKYYFYTAAMQFQIIIFQLWFPSHRLFGRLAYKNTLILQIGRSRFYSFLCQLPHKVFDPIVKCFVIYYLAHHIQQPIPKSEFSRFFLPNWTRFTSLTCLINIFRQNNLNSEKDWKKIWIRSLGIGGWIRWARSTFSGSFSAHQMQLQSCAK